MDMPAMFYVKMLKLKGKVLMKKDNGFLNGGKKYYLAIY